MEFRNASRFSLKCLWAKFSFSIMKILSNDLDTLLSTFTALLDLSSDSLRKGIILIRKTFSPWAFSCSIIGSKFADENNPAGEDTIME
jgi:hypothetical protein